MQERLQKILAAAGYGSRRACEDLIRQGRVTVNGKPAQLGQKADPARDVITVDRLRVRAPQGHVYVALHKPRSVLSATEDERGRRTVRDLVGLPGHLFEVGRLDANSEGLMLLTDDGALAHRLTHPRYAHPKEYHVCVEGWPDDETLAHWRRGVFLDGARTSPAEVSLLHREGERTWLRVVMREGRKRQIRRVAAMLGHPVHRLVRVAIGPLRLGRLRPGEWRHLSAREVEALRALIAADTPRGTARTAGPSAPRRPRQADALGARVRRTSRPRQSSRKGGAED